MPQLSPAARVALLSSPEVQLLLAQSLQVDDPYAPVSPQLVRYDTREAWQAQADSWDALLVDSAWGQGSWSETLQEVLTDAPGLPVIVLTESTEPELALEAMRWGAADIIDKAELETCKLSRTIVLAIQRAHCHQQQRQDEHQQAQSGRLESIHRLSSGLAHELNTPLQYLMDNLEFLNDFWVRIAGLMTACEQDLDDRDIIRWQTHQAELKQLAKDARFEYFRQQVPLAIEECQSGLAHVSQVVNTMQDFVGPINKPMEAVDLNQIAQEVVELTCPQCNEVAEVRSELVGDLPAIMAFASQIHRCLVHLVINAVAAIKAQPAQHGWGRIVIRTGQARQRVWLEIEDNGQGLARAHQEQVFDPFFGTKQEGAGGSQGLAIVQHLIANIHGGQVTLQSAPGSGSIIRLEFPAAQGELLLPLPAELAVPGMASSVPTQQS